MHILIAIFLERKRVLLGYTYAYTYTCVCVFCTLSFSLKICFGVLSMSL